VLDCLQIPFTTSGASLMESGRLRFTRPGYAMFLALFLFVVAAGAQSSSAQSPSPSQNPAETTPPVQPASQAAIGTAGPTPNVADATKNVPKAATDESSMFRLGPGDLIEVSVYNVPELATKARVGNSGDVYLPLIDYVHVGDLSVEEAQALIEKRLMDGGFVRGPHVSIFVDDSTSQGVTVLGEVTKPGIYPDLGDHKLYQIISEAGGFTPNAARKVSIIRHDLTQAIQISLPRNLADDLTGNVDVLPGDTITVPKAPIIYVVGDVGRPSGLLVDNGSLTVLQALALAGGTNRTAKMGGVRIIHKGPTGMTETRVPLKKMLEAKSPDVTLEADDILFVPVSGGRLLAARTMEAALSAATAVTVYSAHP